MDRPKLKPTLASKVFLDYYYLKEELVAFCHAYDLPATGGKIDLTKRIAYFLDTGKVWKSQTVKKVKPIVGEIHEDTVIEDNFVCSQQHRAFFEEKLGAGFLFKVGFQKWLKANAGKTYREAMAVYLQDFAKVQKGTTTIDKQFEYNTYMRDFFKDNQGKKLAEAIVCWKYKRSLSGHNGYEASDLEALKVSGGEVK